MLKRLAILVGTLIAPFMVHAALVPTPEWSGSSGGPLELLSVPIQDGVVNPPKFNASSGDLKKAEFTFSVFVEGSMTGTGLNDTTVDGTVRTTFAVNAGGTPLSPFHFDMPFSMEFDEFGEGSAFFGGGTSFSRTLMDPADAGALALLTGNLGDTFTLLCSTATSVLSAAPSGGSYDLLDGSFGGCSARLVYTYEIEDDPDPDPNGVPEPGTLALVGLAMAGAALAARRRRTV